MRALSWGLLGCLILVAFLVLTGCSSVPQAAAQTSAKPITDAPTIVQAPSANSPQAASLADVTQADLDVAIKIAQANADTVAANCFTTLKKYAVAGTAFTPNVNGVFSAYEATRVRAQTLRKGVPQDLHIACAPMVLDAETALARLLAIVAVKAPVPVLP